MTPARIATAGATTLRFYLSPLDGPDFPWIDFGDVLELSQLPYDYTAEAKERWARVFSAMTRYLPDGTMIVPDCCARGLFANGPATGTGRQRKRRGGYTTAPQSRSRFRLMSRPD